MILLLRWYCWKQGRNQGGGWSPPLARSKLRKMVVLIFSQFCAYNPIKMLLQHYHFLPVIFVKTLDIFEFFASWWSKVAWFGQLGILIINYDVIKLQRYQLWRHFGDVIILRHLNYVIKMTLQKFSIFKPPLSKVLVAPLVESSGDVQSTVTARIYAGWRTFREMSEVLCGKVMSLKLKDNWTTLV